MENTKNFLSARGLLTPETIVHETRQHSYFGTILATVFTIKNNVLLIHCPSNIRKKECLYILAWNDIGNYKHQFVVTSSMSVQSILLFKQQNIEYISDKVFYFKRNKHLYVPRYKVLSLLETEDLCKRLRCKKTCFPCILSKDPQVVYLGVTIGTMIHNTTDDTYRVVV